MQKIFIKLGYVIATMLMFTPVILISFRDKIKSETDLWILLVCSILYDIYFYSIIKFENKKNQVKEHYYKFVKNADKKLNIKLTDKEKFDNLEKYVEELLNIYF